MSTIWCNQFFLIFVFTNLKYPGIYQILTTHESLIIPVGKISQTSSNFPWQPFSFSDANKDIQILIQQWSKRRSMWLPSKVHTVPIFTERGCSVCAGWGVCHRPSCSAMISFPVDLKGWEIEKDIFLPLVPCPPGSRTPSESFHVDLGHHPLFSQIQQEKAGLETAEKTHKRHTDVRCRLNLMSLPATCPQASQDSTSGINLTAIIQWRWPPWVHAGACI